MAEAKTNTAQDSIISLKGEISRKLLWWPLRGLMIVTGFILLRALFMLIVRYCVGFRKLATATVDNSLLTLTEEWFVLGRRIRRARTNAPIGSIDALRFEKRTHYLYLLLGLGCLATGTLIGMQWFVDGLRAGYPYLTLIGAGVVALGVALDLIIYLFIPRGYGSTHVVIRLGSYSVRMVGVDSEEAERFGSAVLKNWNNGAVTPH